MRGTAACGQRLPKKHMGPLVALKIILLSKTLHDLLNRMLAGGQIFIL